MMSILNYLHLSWNVILRCNIVSLYQITTFVEN